MIAGVGDSLLPVLTPEKPAIANPANEIAKRLTGRDYVSWSAIGTFRQCPLKYRFRYLDGLPEESVSSALVFGTGIHTAIEQHFQALLAGDEQPDVERLMFAYRSAWLPHEPDVISFGSKETRESLDDLASRMLTAFLASEYAGVNGRVLGVEEEIRGMLVEGVPDVYGRVDLLTEDADTLTITDIKTSRGKWSPEQVEDSGEQLVLYSHLASEIAPGKKIATRFLVVTKTKEPVIEEYVREVEPGNVKRTLVGVERGGRSRVACSIQRRLCSRAPVAAIGRCVGRGWGEGLIGGRAEKRRPGLLKNTLAAFS
jgi:putative RecB family exonuclease